MDVSGERASLSTDIIGGSKLLCACNETVSSSSYTGGELTTMP